MKTIFWHELKFSRKSLLLWLISMSVLALLGAAEYGVVMSMGQSMTTVMDAMPKITRIMFGVYDSIPLATPVGYYVCMFLWYCMITYTHAAVVGATIISKDERDKTAEYIFTKPFPRSTIITAKILVGIVNVALMTLVTWITTLFAMVPQMNGANIQGTIALTMIGMFFTQLMFMTLGLMLSAIVQKSSTALRFSVLAVLIFYGLSVAIELSGKSVYTFLSPFWYFNAPTLVSKGFNVFYIILAVLITGVCVWKTFSIYKKRDIYY